MLLKEFVQALQHPANAIEAKGDLDLARIHIRNGVAYGASKSVLHSAPASLPDCDIPLEVLKDVEASTKTHPYDSVDITGRSLKIRYLQTTDIHTYHSLEITYPIFPNPDEVFRSVCKLRCATVEIQTFYRLVKKLPPNQIVDLSVSQDDIECDDDYPRVVLRVGGSHTAKYTFSQNLYEQETFMPFGCKIFSKHLKRAIQHMVGDPLEIYPNLSGCPMMFKAGDYRAAIMPFRGE